MFSVIITIRGDIININEAINRSLLILSQKHKIFYMEKRNYKDMKCFKSFILKIDDSETNEFNNKADLLMYLKELI